MAVLHVHLCDVRRHIIELDGCVHVDMCGVCHLLVRDERGHYFETYCWWLLC